MQRSGVAFANGNPDLLELQPKVGRRYGDIAAREKDQLPLLHPQIPAGARVANAKHDEKDDDVAHQSILMPVANGAGSLHLRAMATSTERTRILFVCLGNICRSPAAEVVFRAAARRAGIANRVEIDSAGTSEWYVGNPPDYRAIAHAAKRGYDLTLLRARRVAPADFERHDWILPMDRATLAELQAMRPPAFAGQLALFLEFAPLAGQREILDPYDGGPQAFEDMLDLIEQGSEALAAQFAQR